MTPTAPILDTFNRADGAPGANWPAPIRSSKTLFVIATNAAANNSAGNTQEGYWTTQFGANQEVYLTVATLPPSGQFIRLHARIQSPNTAAPLSYLLYYTHGAPGNVEIDYYDGANFNVISSNVALTLSAGDKLCLRCVGNTLTAEAYQSGAWSVITSGTDSNITGAGYIGIALADTTTRLDDFGGGNSASRLALLGVG